MVFKITGQFHELAVYLWHDILETGDGLWSADTGYHIFALSVGQELSIDLLFAGGGIPGEQHPGTAGRAEIAEDHSHDGHGGAHIVVYLVVVTVEDGPGCVPTAEHRLYGGHQLFPRVGRRFRTGGLNGHLLEVSHQFAKLLGGQLVVEGDSGL